MAKITGCTVTSNGLEYDMAIASDDGSLMISRQGVPVYIKKEDWGAIKETAEFLLYRGPTEEKDNG